MTAGAPSDPLPSDPGWAGGSLYVDERESLVQVTPQQLWSVIEGIGGGHRWYCWPLGWWARGEIDRIVGGPGLRRGRRDPDDLLVGDGLDWWRAHDIQDNHQLRLRAQMRLPGLAWLELIVDSDDAGRTLFRQRALFHPRGLAGHLYWAIIYPFHRLIFGGMQANIARAAQGLAPQSGTSPRVPPPQLVDPPDYERERQNKQHLPKIGDGRAEHRLQPWHAHQGASKDDLPGNAPQQQPVGEQAYLSKGCMLGARRHGCPDLAGHDAQKGHRGGLLPDMAKRP